MPSDGAALFALVEEYAALPHHRTGTAEDEATLEWFHEQLRARGAEVDRIPFAFDRYVARWEVVVDGQPLTSLPLWYSAVGSVRSDAPTVTDVDAFGLMMSPAAAHTLSEAGRRSGEPVVVAATTGSGGRLMVPNRAPAAPGDVHVLLVAGETERRLRTGRVSVRVDAEITRGRSANVVARFGDGDRPLVVATPLSGWFRCAGERGTGIAAVLAIAPLLAEACPVVVVGTSGHELSDLGLTRLLETHDLRRARGVLHVGASVAAVDEHGALSAGRLCNASFPDPELEDALLPAELAPRHQPLGDADRWLGEAREWSRLGVPLVSLTGFFPLFHTPDDEPTASTSPAALATVAQALSAVGEILTRR